MQKYTGKIICARTNLSLDLVAKNNEKIRNLIDDLNLLKTKTSEQIIKIMTLQVNEIVIASLNKDEIAKYSEISGCNIANNATVPLRSNDMRHMIRSGHITGIKYNGVHAKHCLTAQDLSDMKATIKSPDIVRKTYKNRKNKNSRLVFEKNIDKKHRLVIEISSSGKLSIVTYFNV